MRDASFLQGKSSLLQLCFHKMQTYLQVAESTLIVDSFQILFQQSMHLVQQLFEAIQKSESSRIK